ncbi:MAG: hypothetical protein GXO90_01605 [FCB group bacterium]|nr:hypothetical protein [FCB group bacterium]
MIPLHPLVVHLPIAFTLLVICIQALRVLGKINWPPPLPIILLMLAIVTGFIASFTGEKSFSDLEQQLSPQLIDLIEQHELFANAFVWAGLITVLGWTWLHLKHWNPRFLDWMMLIALLGLGVLIWETGQHGGDLVYRYSIGILP